MKFLLILLSGIFLINPAFSKDTQSNFEKLLPVLSAPVKGEVASPSTTEELKKLFDTPKETLPRIFIKNFPSDFKEKGNKELFAKVIGVLILKENEKILSERLLFNALKQKFDKQEEWTKAETEYFNYLVEKYDAVVLKTTSTKINDLVYKIDEIPLSMGIAQAALQTDWGKTNLASPYAQKGWKDTTHYQDLEFPDLISATSSYVKEMNATPNYSEWRNSRMQANNKPQTRYSLKLVQALNVYLPEDVFYAKKLKELLKKNPFLFDYDKTTFNE